MEQGAGCGGQSVRIAGVPALKMVVMKSGFVLLLLCASLIPAVSAHAKKAVLPDACGDDSVKFDVSTQKDAPPPAGPAEGKAQIVFIETVIKPPACLGCGDFTTRIGMDGAWVGANKEDTYFAFSVAAGEHHFCAAGKGKEDVGVTSFTAEAGKTYYYEVKRTLKIQHGDGPGRPVTGSERTFDFTQLTEDQGKYRVKASALATFNPK